MVQLARLPLLGVPNAGVTSVGLVARTGAPDPVAVVHTGKALAPPPTRTSVVAPAARLCCAPVAVVPVATSAYAVVPVSRPVPPPATGKFVQFVKSPDAGVPSTGVVSVGLVRVLFVSVSVPVRVANDVGNVLVPLVRSLLVSVCVSVVPTMSPTGIPDRVSSTLVPSQNRYCALPDMTAIPVPPEVFSVRV